MENTNSEQTKNKGSTKNINNKTSYVSIPRKLIFENTANKKLNGINVKAKYLYIILKKLSVGNTTTVSYEKLLTELQWVDKRTLKKYLEILKQNKYINYDFTRITYYKPLEIKLINYSPYILLDRETVNLGLLVNINQTDIDKKYIRKNLVYRENGIVYLYYLEANYNTEWGYACPSRRELKKVLSLNDIYLTKLTQYYHEHMICEFKQGKIITNQSNMDNLIMRARNRYIVNNKNKNGNKRYKKHKKDIYFF